MKTLLLMRHAKSSWQDEGLADHDRPLNRRGQRDAPRMGQLLRHQQLLPDTIVCSTAQRAQTTARQVAEAAGYNGPVVLDERLYLATANEILHAVRRLAGAGQTVLVVGHNPGMEQLVSHFAGKTEPFPTAALAQLQLEVPAWSQVDAQTPGRLAKLWRPRDLA